MFLLDTGIIVIVHGCWVTHGLGGRGQRGLKNWSCSSSRPLKRGISAQWPDIAVRPLQNKEGQFSKELFAIGVPLDWSFDYLSGQEIGLHSLHWKQGKYRTEKFREYKLWIQISLPNA